MTHEETNGRELMTRKSALMLHAMSKNDQRWMLEQLPASSVQVLQSLLSELESLGIPADVQVLDAVISTKHHVPMVDSEMRQRKTTYQEDVNAIEGADVAVLLSILRNESLTLTSYFLHMHPWPWRAQFLGLLDAAKRRQLAEVSLDNQMEHRETAQKLRAAMAHGIANKIRLQIRQSVPLEVGTRSRHGWWKRLPFAGKIVRGEGQ